MSKSGCLSKKSRPMTLKICSFLKVDDGSKKIILPITLLFRANCKQVLSNPDD